MKTGWQIVFLILGIIMIAMCSYAISVSGFTAE
jgi:hypothetical protein